MIENMSETIQIQASDGHILDAYIARPAHKPIGGLVVIQEIFGVNHHIRDVADSYAKHGFLAIAPALFDRVQKGVELGYEGEDRVEAMEFYKKLDVANAIRDIAAALDWAGRNGGGKAGVIGYCAGGTLAWLSATRLDPDVAVGYYAGGIDKFAAETPQCPVMLHFGMLDTHIPKEAVDKVAKAHPEVQIFWYEKAGHGFNRNVGISYEPEAAQLARERSLALLTQCVMA
jgi:carboxymethylenebutenolidase